MHDPRNFVWRHQLTVPDSYNLAFVDLNDAAIDCSNFDFVFFYWMESVNSVSSTFDELRTKYNPKNFALIAGGFSLNDLTNLPYNVMYHPQWLEQTVNFNRSYQSRNSDQRSYYFDALLGRPKPDRLYIFKKIKESNHENKFLYNIDLPDFFSSNVFDLEIKPIQDLKVKKSFDSMVRLPEEYRFAFISQVIPDAIYEKSWYSIISETAPMLFFPTEKTFKPLLARRIFIPFASQHFYQQLRCLGFKTFNSVIDENFDQEVNIYRRHEKAWQQVELLLDQDPKLIYQQCKLEIEHNQQLCLNKQYWSARLQKFINSNL